MKKNDKIIVLFGVVILVLASIGIYYYDFEDEPTVETDIENFMDITGEYKEILSKNSIVISDDDHFYPLIVTPLAVHYNSDGDREVLPLFVKNRENPSDSIIKLQNEYLDNYNPLCFDNEDFESRKSFSLFLAEKYWKKSDAVLIIEDSKEGYFLGVNAVPISSYLGIPVIVTDEVDGDVKEVLGDLEVEKIIACGNDLGGYQQGYKFLTFSKVDQIVENATDLLFSKFDDFNYITITNPLDSYPPEVLETSWQNQSGTAIGSAFVPSAIMNVIGTQFGGKKGDKLEIDIPEEWEYAKLTLDLISEEDPENVEKFGSTIGLNGMPTGPLDSSGSPPITDENGEIINDRLYFEEIYYDYGGETFTVEPGALSLLGNNPDWHAIVKVEHMENPYDPLLPKVSSLAPYLTAYRKGIVFAKPDFAFANGEGKKLQGKEFPGSTQPKTNPGMIPLINEHVYNNIHKPINQLIADIKDMDVNNVEKLKTACEIDPFNICIVGGTTMMPQYYYRNPHNNPFDKLSKGYGTNTPSDFIYGNIDPQTPIMHKTTNDYTEDDLYSDLRDNGKRYPTMENIVGRITGGFDIQDSSALIARTLFYDDVLNSFNEDWKNNALVMSGAGLEFQQLPIFKTLYDLANAHEPMKFPTGQQHFLGLRTKEYMEEKGGFEVEKLERGQAQRIGFSDESLDEIKKANLLSRLLFPKNYIKMLQGFENFESLTDPDWWRTINDDGSGIHGGESQKNSNLIQVNAHGIFSNYNTGDVLMYSHGIPILSPLMARYFSPYISPLPRSGLGALGGYSVRSITQMDMGPSVMFVECCGGGKIDSLDPYNTLSAAYLYSGVNSFICPSTFSAISGYLEPKNYEVGLGIRQYIEWNLKAKKEIYPETEFCGWMFEHSYKQMFEKDATIGEALTEARNNFLIEEFEETYLWTPPLNHGEDSLYFKPGYTKTSSSGASNVPVEKYAAVFQLNLLGDPAFNPYQPCNNG